MNKKFENFELKSCLSPYKSSILSCTCNYVYADFYFQSLYQHYKKCSKLFNL